MLSWFSFWLGLDAIPGRVTLLVTCMLTLVTMFTGADIPPVAYVKVILNCIRMKCQVNHERLQALDLWMAGCMVFVFAALAEFVVVKVLDVQYQQQIKQTPKPLLPLRLTSTMEKGQCQTVAVFDGHATNVRSRKANSQTPTTPVPVIVWLKMDELFALSTSLLLIADESAGQWRPETNQSEAVDFVGFVDG